MPYIGTKPSTANFSDLNGAKLILDADADTSITADTDDQIDIEIAGSDELKITAAMIAPATADGSALGGASNEWSDLYLADSSVIYFGADQDVTVTHDPDDGLFLKSIATADNNPVLLTLQTGETDMAANDVMGKISFQAPDEGTGTDAILVAAAIQAVAETDFSSSVNKTSLQFMTGASEAAAEKMRITSAGHLLLGDTTADANLPESSGIVSKYAWSGTGADAGKSHVVLKSAGFTYGGPTNEFEADTYFTIRKQSANLAGGVQLSSHGGGSRSFTFTAYVASVATGTDDDEAGIFHFFPYLQSGWDGSSYATSANVAANNNIMVLQGTGVSSHIFKGDGDVHNSGGNTAMGVFDDEDDGSLVTALRHMHFDDKQAAEKYLGAMVQKDAAALIRAGIAFPSRKKNHPENIRPDGTARDGRYHLSQRGMTALGFDYTRQVQNQLAIAVKAVDNLVPGVKQEMDKLMSEISIPTLLTHGLPNANKKEA